MHKGFPKIYATRLSKDKAQPLQSVLYFKGQGDIRLCPAQKHVYLRILPQTGYNIHCPAQMAIPGTLYGVKNFHRSGSATKKLIGYSNEAVEFCEQPERPNQQKLQIGQERRFPPFYLMAGKLPGPTQYKSNQAGLPKPKATGNFPVLQLYNQKTKKADKKQRTVRERRRELQVVINNKGNQERGPVDKTIHGAHKIEMRKGYAPNKSD